MQWHACHGTSLGAPDPLRHKGAVLAQLAKKHVVAIEVVNLQRDSEAPVFYGCEGGRNGNGNSHSEVR